MTITAIQQKITHFKNLRYDWIIKLMHQDRDWIKTEIHYFFEPDEIWRSDTSIQQNTQCST